MRAAALALIVSLTGCAFGVKHPAATAGIVGGVIGFSTCELGTSFDGRHGTCAVVGGGAALLLGGAVLLAIALGGDGNTILMEKDEDIRPEPPSIDDVPPPDAAPEPDAAPMAPSPVTPPGTIEPTPATPAPGPAPGTLQPTP